MGDTTFRGRVVIYSIIGCEHCSNAKATLTELNIPFLDISLDQYEPSVRSELFEKTGQHGLPQIFFNDKFIGGNDDLSTLVLDKKALENALHVLKTEAPSSTAPNLPDPSLLSKRSTDVSDISEVIPEPDEYALLVRDMKNDGVVKDIRRGFTKYTNCFTGRQLVDWLIAKKGIDREKAISLGQSLISRHFGHSVPPDQEEVFHDNDQIYRLLEDDESDALNAGDFSSYETRSATELSQELRQAILKIFSEHVSADGKRVDYARIGDSDDFLKFVRLTKDLHCVNIAHASREEKLAFFINIYNALVIHATIVKGPPTNMFQRYKFFNTVRYIIGGYAYTLQDIENGVLRANSRGVAQIFRPFGNHDPRRNVALKEVEPLIHFALVCGAKSCPPIRIYDPKDIDAELLMSAQAFLESPEVEVDVNGQTVTLSTIFKWYRHDFGQNDHDVITWIESKLPDGPKRDALRTVMKGKHCRINYAPYDWSVNAKSCRVRSRQRNRFVYGKDSCQKSTFVFYFVVAATLVILGMLILIFAG